MSRSRRGAIFSVALLLAGSLGAVLSQPAWGTDCNGFVQLGYISGPSSSATLGDTIRVRLTLFTGNITNGANNVFQVDRLRFDLDCSADAALGLPCTNDGNVIKFLGNVTIDHCFDSISNPVTFAANATSGSFTPNEVVFTPSAEVVINANTALADGCKVEFDVQVAAYSGDSTPNQIEQLGGYRTVAGVPDTRCDNGLHPMAAQSGAITLAESTPTPTNSPASTPTGTQTPTATATTTPTGTATPTPTDTPTALPTSTPTQTATSTPTPTNTATDTPTTTPTPTVTDSPTQTPTNTPTETPTATSTPTDTPTPTTTPTQTPTNTATSVPTNTPTNSPTSTLTATPTNTPSITSTPSVTITPGGPTLTPTLTATRTPTLTRTPTNTPTSTPTVVNTSTARPTPTGTLTGPEHVTLFWKALQTLSSTTPIYHHSGNFTAPLAKTDFVLPFGGQISLLSVHCDPGVTTGGQEFRLMVNDLTTALTCTVSAGQSECSDTTNTVAFNANDDINLRSVGTVAGSTAPDCMVVAKLADSAGNPYDSTIAWGGGGAAFDGNGGRPLDGSFCGPGDDLDNITECLGANANDPVNAQSAAFIAPVGGLLSGLGVRQSVVVAAGDSVTYTVVNVTANRDTGVVVTMNAGELKQTATTCTHDCYVAPGDLLTVRFNRTGTGDTFANRNLAVTIDGMGQDNTSRRNSAIGTAQTVFGNYDSPFVDTVNTVRTERDMIAKHLAVQVPLPAVAPFTVSLCVASPTLPRSCLSTSLGCMVNAGQQTCVDETNSMTFHTGDLYTVEIVTTGSTGGPPAYAFLLNDIPTPTPTSATTATPTLPPTGTPTDTPTPVPTDTPTNVPTDTPTPLPTDTPTSAPTATATSLPTTTPTHTATSTPTETPTSTATSTAMDTPTETPTASETPTDTPTATSTETPTDTPTNTPTDTPTSTPTQTNSPTITPIASDTPTNTPTATTSPTHTPSSIATPSETPTATVTSTPLAIAFVRDHLNKTASTCNATVSLSPVAPGVTVGNTVVVSIAAQTGSAPLFTCSDTKGNTYTTDRRFQNATGKPTVALCHAFIGTALSTADSIKVASSGATGTCAYTVHALEFSNIRAVSPVDATNASGTNSTSANSGAITLTNRDAVVGAIAWNDNAGITGNGSAGWTNVLDVVSAALEGVTEYTITSVSPQSATSGNNAAKPWVAAVVGYLPAPTPTP